MTVVSQIFKMVKVRKKTDDSLKAVVNEMKLFAV